MQNIFRATAFAASLVCGFYMRPAFSQEKATVATSHEMTQAQFETLKKTMLEGTPEDLKKLIQDGLDANSTYRCHTPLNMAIKNMAFAFGSVTMSVSPDETLEKIKILIDAGADLNNRGACKISVLPLSSALYIPFQIYSLEKIFLEEFNKYMDEGKGKCDFFGISKPCSEINHEDRDRVKYVISQIYKGAQEAAHPYMMKTIKLLVENGANVNARDNMQKTALHAAMLLPEETAIEPVKYLIEKGVDLNAQDKNGNTALFSASGSFNKKIVKLLIDAGADTEIWNNEGAYYNEVVGRTKHTSMDADGQISSGYVEDNVLY